MSTPPYSESHAPAEQSVGVPATMPPDRLTLVRLINVLLRRRVTLAAAVLLTMSATIAVTLLTPRSYSASASFVPQGRSQTLSELVGITVQNGLAVPGTRPSQSSAFYADLLRSRELLYEVVQTRYAFTGSRGPLWSADPVAMEGTLVDLFEMERGDSARNAAETVDRLRDRMATRTNRETGVVTFSVTTPWPALAYQVAQRLLALVSAFDIDRRQSQAAEERRFIEGRLAEAGNEVRANEDSLARFLERNRDFANSPQLMFERDRLQREVTRRHQVLTELSAAYERARIEEVRNTVVLTIVDSPRVPPRPDSRHLVLKILFSFVAGLVIGLGAALWREFMDRSRTVEPDAFEEFVKLKHEATAGVRWLMGRRRSSTD